jgi:hypothetical protein
VYRQSGCAAMGISVGNCECVTQNLREPSMELAGKVRRAGGVGMEKAGTAKITEDAKGFDGNKRGESCRIVTLFYCATWNLWVILILRHNNIKVRIAET